MKKLVIVLLFFVPIICNAQASIEVNQDEENPVEKIEEWRKSAIVADEETMNYGEYFSEAIANPGSLILVERNEEVLKFKPIFKELIEVKRREIVYNDLKRRISLVKSSEKKERSSYLMLFSMASLILMIISNILFKKAYKPVVVLTAFIAFVTLAFAAAIFALLVLASTPVAILAFVIFLIAVIFAASNKSKNYKIFSVMYYILAIIYFILLFA